MNDAEMLALKQQEIEHLTEKVLQLTQQLDWFKRQLFGRKSEKKLVHNPHQGSLFDLPAPAQDSAPSTPIKAHQRRSKKQPHDHDVNDTGLRFDDSVPQEIIELSIPELEGDKAHEYEIIDYKETTRLAQRIGSYVVLIYRRPVVRHQPSNTLAATPAAPDNVLDGCYADVSLLAGLMVDKAIYHLPLYRQHQRLRDSGVRLSRTTLIHWMQKSIALLQPIYQAQRRHILQSKVLAMDEVPIKAGRKGKGRMQQTYFWPLYGEADEVAFTWSRSRGYQHAVDQLHGFSGTLLTDGYAAYEKAISQLNQQDAAIVHATCWAHSRRAFEKALAMEPDTAQQALAYIGQLYALEATCREQDLTAEALLAHRQEYSEPVINAFFTWVYEQRQRMDLLPSNPLCKALQYVTQRADQLKVFLSNPHVPLDTNHLERALRVIPMGRKNYLFCWSELGAEQLGMLQSLMVTCRLQNINPYMYLVDVLQRVSLHPASKVEELTPRMWKTLFKDNCLTSDLDRKAKSQP
ncbi:MAG: IS66 family transposase [Cyanobacteria bacterium P01_H01_bin.152]